MAITTTFTILATNTPQESMVSHKNLNNDGGHVSTG